MRRDSFVHQVVRSVLVSLVTLVIVLALVGGGLWLAFRDDATIEPGSWLVLELNGDLPSHAPPGSFPASLLGDDTMSLQDALDALGKATLDERVDGVIWKISAGHGAGWGKLQELRQATRALRDAGKPAYAWVDNMNLRTLYLAAACDTIAMPRGGYFGLQGMLRQSLHVRGTLEKLGVTPHVSKLREYKSAAELITETAMTGPAREQAQRLLDHTWEAITHAVAEERGLPRERLLEVMERGGVEPIAAAEIGIIDEVLYWQGLEQRLLAAGDEDERQTLATVTAATYRDVAWSDLGRDGEATIAVVHAQGMIMGRENGVNPLLGITMGHESVVRELQRARRDDDVKAIVFRVDSPGGDGLTSDLIGHEVALCAAAKPTVVSMVSVAASGGYQIAFRADRLLANPLCTVGSIGSISAFFDMSGFHDRIGLSTDAVAAGPMAGLGRDDRAPTTAEWEAFASRHEEGFDAWLREVAAKRGFTLDEVKARAYGRVFTGEEAVANGLIDGLGNLDQAIAEAATLADLDPERVTVVHLPEPAGPLDLIMGGDSGPDDPVTLALRWLTYRQLRAELETTERLLASPPVLAPVPR